jgi:hypothetical protein
VKKTDMMLPGSLVAVAGGAADGLGVGQRAGGGDVLEENLRELAGGVVHRPQCSGLPAIGHLQQNAEFQTSTCMVITSSE